MEDAEEGLQDAGDKMMWVDTLLVIIIILFIILIVWSRVMGQRMIDTITEIKEIVKK